MPVDNQQLDRELHRIAITTIIYNKDGKFLVTKRAPHKKVHPNKWTVPGGGLTIDDYINTPQTQMGGADAGWYGAVETALQREIAEEVNVKIGEPKYLLDLTFIRPDKVPVLVLSYYAPYISGDVKIDEDTSEFAWVTLADAKKLDLIAGIYEELEEVAKLLKEK
jgi:8-oxo-dGTP pyrophosphatase MutT (NUDIX family)